MANMSKTYRAIETRFVKSRLVRDGRKHSSGTKREPKCDRRMKALFLPIILAMSSLAFAQSPAAVEREILAHLDDSDKYSTYLGEYDETKNGDANKAIRQTLVKNGKRIEILRYAFPKLKDRMYVATSPDGKLRIYTWDLGTGGTLHDFESVYQFQGDSGAVNTWFDPVV